MAHLQFKDLGEIEMILSSWISIIREVVAMIRQSVTHSSLNFIWISFDCLKIKFKALFLLRKKNGIMNTEFPAVSH